MSPTFTSTSIDTFYITGSLAQVLLQAYDTGINFESDVATYFPGFGDILTNTGVGYIYIGQYGITKNVT